MIFEPRESENRGEKFFYFFKIFLFWFLDFLKFLRFTWIVARERRGFRATPCTWILWDINKFGDKNKNKNKKVSGRRGKCELIWAVNKFTFSASLFSDHDAVVDTLHYSSLLCWTCGRNFFFSPHSPFFLYLVECETAAKQKIVWCT